jgi:hypothetical protein
VLRSSPGNFAAVFLRHEDVDSKILAIDSMQSFLLSFKVIFLFLFVEPVKLPAVVLTSIDRHERAGSAKRGKKCYVDGTYLAG